MTKQRVEARRRARQERVDRAQWRWNEGHHEWAWWAAIGVNWNDCIDLQRPPSVMWNQSERVT